MNLADALVTTLRGWDLEYVFGVSGANIEHLHDGIHRLGGGELSAVLAKSEVWVRLVGGGSNTGVTLLAGDLVFKSLNMRIVIADKFF